MFRYEWKKVFDRTGGRIAVILLAVFLIVTCYFAMDVSYMNEQGVREKGPAAVAKLREAQKEWTGVLDEEKLSRVIEENRRITSTPEAQSKDYKQNDIAFGWKQGFEEIRNLLNFAYAEDFQTYNYYRADSLRGEEAFRFYTNRTALLKEWLEGEKERFSEAEREFLIRQYETLETPFYYDYMLGWTQVLLYVPTVIMLTMLILCYLVAGIFSNEFQWKADAVFFAAVYGRSKAVAAKVKAGFGIVTLVYWTAVLLFTGIVLLYLGAGGGTCPVQADMSGWKSFYHIRIWQEYLITVAGGYLGCLFLSFVSMLISARMKSAVPAVMAPFVLLFIPSFAGNINNPVVSRIMGLLPDRLLQINSALKTFDLYELGGRVTGAVPVLLALYGFLTILLAPAVYHIYRRKQIG